MSYIVDSFVKGVTAGIALKEQQEYARLSRAVEQMEGMSTEELLEFKAALKSDQGSLFDRLGDFLAGRRKQAEETQESVGAAAGLPPVPGDGPVVGAASGRGAASTTRTVSSSGNAAADERPPQPPKPGDAVAAEQATQASSVDTSQPVLLAASTRRGLPGGQAMVFADDRAVSLAPGDSHGGFAFGGLDDQNRARFEGSSGAARVGVGQNLPQADHPSLVPTPGIPAPVTTPLTPAEAELRRRQGAM
jgi:hypothetical protein